MALPPSVDTGREKYTGNKKKPKPAPVSASVVAKTKKSTTVLTSQQQARRIESPVSADAYNQSGIALAIAKAQSDTGLIQPGTIEELGREFYETGKILSRIPAGLDEILVNKAPTTDVELALWMKVVLENNGLIGPFALRANPMQEMNSSHFDFLADSFFGRVHDCIVLGNRAGGKTLIFASLLLLEALFKPGIKLAHLAAQQAQAQRCYEYFLKFANHSLFSHMFMKPPTVSRALFKNGSDVEILVGTISGVNCLHGDTLIECARDVTEYPDGIPIRDLVGKDIVVPTISEHDGTIEYRKAIGMYSGQAKCVKVIVSSTDVTGVEKLDEIICTPNHPFPLLGSFEYRFARELHPGDRLVPWNTPVQRIHMSHNTNKNVYREMQLPVSKTNRTGKFVLEHREIAKAVWGKDIITDEVDVHHIDGNTLNNRIDNLSWMYKSDHVHLHNVDGSKDIWSEKSVHTMSKSCTYFESEPLWQDREWLQEEIKHHTVSDIAYLNKVHSHTIRKWIYLHNLTDIYYTYHSRNERGIYPSADGVTENLPWKDKSWLVRECKTKTLRQIANENQCSVAILKRWTNKFNVLLKESKYNRFIQKKYHIKDEIERLLLGGWTNIEIAEEFDVAPNTISRYISKFNIGDIRSDLRNVKDYYNIEMIIERLKKGMSQHKIAKELGCSQSVLNGIIKSNNLSHYSPIPEYREFEKMQALVDAGKSQMEIAKELDCSQCAVQKSLKRFGLETIFMSRNTNHLSKEWLYEQIVIKHRTHTDIAKEQGVTQGAISILAAKFDIKKVDELYTDKEWFTQQLRQNKSISTMSKQTGFPASTLQRWMKKHGLQLQPVYENHVVVSVEELPGLYDVYDLSVQIHPEDVIDGVETRHNFMLSLGLCSSNSPHPVVSQIDEIELMPWGILQEAFNMAATTEQYESATRLTSSRKKSTGTMQRIIDEAEERGFKIYQWNIWDTVQRCVIPVSPPVYPVEDKLRENQITMVSAECLTCELMNLPTPVCLGRAAKSTGGIIKLKDVFKKAKNVDLSVWIAQHECLKPGTSDLVYDNFSKVHHVLDYETFLRHPDVNLPVAYAMVPDPEVPATTMPVAYCPDLPVYAGQDAGFNCPATIFAQEIDGTLFVFHEIRVEKIAPSVYIKEYLMPTNVALNVEYFVCDPTGKTLISDMDVAGIFTVEGENPVEPGIDNVKSKLGASQLFFDKKCVWTIKDMCSYSRSIHGNIVKKHDFHMCDCVRYLCMEFLYYSQTMDTVYDEDGRTMGIGA